MNFDAPRMTVPRWLEVYARTIYGEARGEPYEGQVAVAAVIRNRVKRPARFGEGYEGVCLKPKQFSCWNEGDPNREILQRAGLFDRDMVKAMGIACLVFSGDLHDPTNGADHYFATYIKPPKWSEDMEIKARIGRHLFVKES